MATRELIINENNSWSGHEHNHTFLNKGDGTFIDVSRLSGTDTEGDGRSVAIVDWDDDGSLDLVLRSRSAPRVQVFHNRYDKPGNFAAFELRGNGESCNRDAIGSRVTLQLKGRSIVRALRAGEGFLAQSSKRLHFGLGSSEQIESVVVRWADGSSSRFENLSAGKRYLITQGMGDEGLSEIPARTASMHSLPSVSTEALDTARRAVLAYPLPLAEMSVPSFENPRRNVRDLLGSPVLLNLWQVDCEGCTIEFREFKGQREKLAKTGLRIITLNADDLSEMSLDSVHNRLEYFDLLNADAGYIGDLLAPTMHTIHKHIYGEAAVSGAVTMPTSWLLDAKGQLLAIYTGAIEMDQLFLDLAAINTGEEHLTLNRMSRGIRLANKKRKLFDLASAFKLQASQSIGKSSLTFQRLAEYYLAEDELQRGFIMLDGKPRPMVDTRYNNEQRKSVAQQTREQEASLLNESKD